MNLYVKINSVKYSIISFSYRLNNVSSDTKISHLFSCVVVAEDAAIAVSDTIEFYSNDVLIYSDPINSAIKNESRISIQSEKEINAPIKKMNNINTVIYYSTTTLRIPLNFDIMPLDDLTTSIGNFTAQKVVNYKLFTEVTIG